MRVTVDPIFKDVKQSAQQIQIRRERTQSENKPTIKRGSSQNWKPLAYSTLKSLYHYDYWSKKKILKDGGYANEKLYFIVKQGWQPDPRKNYVLKYHKFEKEMPSDRRLRILMLQGGQALVKDQVKYGNDWRDSSYERIIDI